MDSYFQRCPKDRENPYSMINRQLIRNESLSIECIWLLTYLLTNQDNWKICIQQIINHCKGRMGRDKIYKLIKEAIDAGFMRREQRHINGRLTQVVYYVSEWPQPKEHSNSTESVVEQLPENQDPVTQLPENTHYKNKQDIRYSKDKKESIGEQAASRPDSPPRAASSSPKKVQRKEHVETTHEEHESLIKDYGAQKTEEAYQRLSEWKQDTPRSKWKKSDYRSVRRWVIDAISEKTRGYSAPPQQSVSRHHGLQKDHSPNHPSKIKDFSNMGLS